MSLAVSINELVQSRNLNQELVLQALREVLSESYSEIFGNPNVFIEADLPKDELHIFLEKMVMNRVRDPRVQISLAEAKRIFGEEMPIFEKQKLKIPAHIQEDFSPNEVNYISQKLLKRIHYYEQNVLELSFKNKEGEIEHGTVVKIKPNGSLFVDLGNAIGYLDIRDMSQNDRYEVGDRIKFLISKVFIKRFGNQKQLQILLSRKSPTFVRKLLVREVPELADNTVEVLRIARIPGYKTKILVHSNKVDAASVCIGPHGLRILAVVKELGGEKIDIINYSDKLEQLVRQSLVPAKVEKITLHTQEDGNTVAYAIVENNQLPFAFGKSKYNVVLASKICHLPIQVISVQEAMELNLLDNQITGLHDAFASPLSQLNLDEDLQLVLQKEEIFSVEQLGQLISQGQKIENITQEDWETIQQAWEEYTRPSLAQAASAVDFEISEDLPDEMDEEDSEDTTPLEILDSMKPEWITALQALGVESLEHLVGLYNAEELDHLDLDKEVIQGLKNLIEDSIIIEE